VNLLRNGYLTARADFDSGHSVFSSCLGFHMIVLYKDGAA